MSSGFSIKPWLHLLSINTTGIPIAGAVWFLTALFFSDIIYIVLTKYKIRWIIILLVVIGSYADQILPHPLPWALSASCVGLGLYWMGNVIAKNQDKLKAVLNMPLPMCFVLSILEVKLIFDNGYVNMREGTYATVPLFWLNAFISIFIGISLSKRIANAIKGTYIASWLISVGRDSIVYLCCNQIVIELVTVVLEQFMPFLMYRNVCILLVSMIALYVISVVLTRTKLKIVIGK